MAPKKKTARGKTKKKPVRKVKPAKQTKAQAAPKRAETKKAEPSISVQRIVRVEPSVQESVRITIENIRAETPIGDLLVAFPRTREILVKNGLRLEAEDAGDIYMTLDAFCALNGLKTESLVQDLVITAKEPPLQPPVPQLATPPSI